MEELVIESTLSIIACDQQNFGPKKDEFDRFSFGKEGISFATKTDSENFSTILGLEI